MSDLSNTLFMIPRQIPGYLATARKILFPQTPENENCIQKVIRVFKEYLEVIRRVICPRYNRQIADQIVSQMQQDFTQIRQQAKNSHHPICAYLIAPYDESGAILSERTYLYYRYKIEEFEKGGYSVVPYLAYSMQEVCEQLLPQIQKDYPGRPIELLDFTSHGNSEILFVPAAPPSEGAQEADVFSRNYVKVDQFRALAPNASIILDVCSSGKGDNSMAEAIAQNNPGKTVFAPTRSLWFSKPIFSRTHGQQSLAHLIHGPAICNAYRAKKFFFAPNNV